MDVSRQGKKRMSTMQAVRQKNTPLRSIRRRYLCLRIVRSTLQASSDSDRDIARAILENWSNSGLRKKSET